MTGIERLREHGDNLQELLEALASDARVEEHAIAEQIKRETQPKSDPAADVSMSAYDLLPEDEREAVAWVREHGGVERVKGLLDWVVGHCSTRQQLDFDFWLSGRVMHELGFEEDVADRDEVERRLLARLMPEGMEWPRFEDDAPVCFWDEWGLGTGGTAIVGSVTLRDDSFALNASWYDKSERVKRPTPKVLDADGAEIRVGDTVWLVDGGGPYTVKTTSGRLGTVEFEADEWTAAKPCAITHRAPVLAADGRPLREGETVWDKDDRGPFTVRQLPGDGDPYISLEKDGTFYYRFASYLTHERPDSWERLEEDAKADPGEYCVTYELCAAYMGREAEEYAKAADLVRRARALAERGQ